MLSVLLIEDDPDLLNLLAWALKKAGHRVVVAANGADGVRIFKENPTEIVITDMVMPEMDGFEVLREVRKICPGVKAVAMSGGGKSVPRTDLKDPTYRGPESRGGTDYLTAAGLLGADKIIQKPFSPAELVEIISKYQTGDP